MGGSNDTAQARRAQPWGPDGPYRSVFTNSLGQASLFVAGKGRPQAVISSLAALLTVWAVVDLVRRPAGQQAAPLLWALTAATVALLFGVLSLSARRRWFLTRAGDLVTASAAGALVGMIPLLVASFGAGTGTGGLARSLWAFALGMAPAVIVGCLMAWTVLRRGRGRFVFRG